MNSGWCFGENARTGLKGDFPAECVYVLPTMSKPPPEILSLFAHQPGEGFERLNGPSENELAITDGHEGSKQHTLEEYSLDHFRPPPKRTLSKSLTLNTARRRQNDILWKYSREPLKQPLLKKLLGKEELCQQAVICFLAILKYTGDHPSKRSRTGNELTDQIFEGPLKNELLKDEIYCQVIKQLTDNRNGFSEDRGWDLMWLASGCFSPSGNLLKEVTSFLRTARKPIAADCLNRLQKTLR